MGAETFLGSSLKKIFQTECYLQNEITSLGIYCIGIDPEQNIVLPERGIRDSFEVYFVNGHDANKCQESGFHL